MSQTNNIGRRMKIRRAVFAITQEELAKALGITQGYLSDMERGRNVVPSKMLDKIAAALQCRPEDLLNEKRHLA